MTTLPGPNFLNRFQKIYSNIKFRENPSSGSRVGPCARIDRQTNDELDVRGSVHQQPSTYTKPEAASVVLGPL
jgi:hypothetical protein